jgi:hypothetical protein
VDLVIALAKLWINLGQNAILLAMSGTNYQATCIVVTMALSREQNAKR